MVLVDCCGCCVCVCASGCIHSFILLVVVACVVSFVAVCGSRLLCHCVVACIVSYYLWLLHL